MVEPYAPTDERERRVLERAQDMARRLGADLQIGMMCRRDGRIVPSWSLLATGCSDGEEYAISGRSFPALMPTLLFRLCMFLDAQKPRSTSSK